MARYKNVFVNGKLCQEHRLVWERAHGPIPPGYEIHHVDGNGQNNALENLQMLSRSEHTKLHARLRKSGTDVVDTTDPVVAQHQEWTRRYCVENKEKRREYNARYRATHKEQERIRKRQYYVEHREERLEYNKHYRQENIDRIREYSAAYDKERRQKNAEKVRERRRELYRKNFQAIAAQQADYRARHKDDIRAYHEQYRQTHRPLMNAKDRLKVALKRGYPPEEIAKRQKDVEDARILVEQLIKNKQ